MFVQNPSSYIVIDDTIKIRQKKKTTKKSYKNITKTKYPPKSLFPSYHYLSSVQVPYLHHQGNGGSIVMGTPLEYAKNTSKIHHNVFCCIFAYSNGLPITILPSLPQGVLFPLHLER